MSTPAPTPTVSPTILISYYPTLTNVPSTSIIPTTYWPIPYNNFPPQSSNVELPVLRFLIYLLCTMIILGFILYLNRRNPPSGPPTPNAIPVPNLDGTTPNEADLVKSMTPEERKEYVTNFLKTQKYVDDQDNTNASAASSSFRVTKSSTFLAGDTDNDVESNLVGAANDGNNNKSNCQKASPNCAICLDQFQSGEDICSAQNTDCTHEFHLECIFPWLLKSQDCPCCRRDYLSIVASPTNDATTTITIVDTTSV